ncbi:epithelial-stromal interaction protein 1 [Striga asiatica]|uniref:Epithelial-stromal interaction protein 1 n=1 Tax=Striga asiatica TaxID=4170 RepID=A0A5A7R1J5_STRAF|nr:epithelial-stromal interaction protein 1 [Striga asiatica]
MLDSVNGDQLPRKITTMEESNEMTIEFLRARLLSERSVSKSAKQRADELAKRVTELEEQLKFVSLQRKKAEKATEDVLAILENHGISDMSENFDSCSEQEENLHDFELRNGSPMTKLTSTDTKPRKVENEASSGSEIESSPSTGRSLSWRSTKDSQNYLEKKKYIDSVRRRASFPSNSQSARRVGKSCRRIRHRETRLTQESQNNCTEKSECSVDASDGSNSELVVLRESPEYENKKIPSKSTKSEMESALQHQAQLIGRYEEEERAQIKWEEKFRENNSGTQDSGDLGTHSDVTEERFEMKSPEPPSKPDSVTKEPPIKPSESSASEFSFPASKEKIDKRDFPSKKPEAPEHRLPQHPNRISPQLELAVLPQGDPSNSLSSVLEALEKAKLSLNEKLNSNSAAPSPEKTPYPMIGHKFDKSFQIPFRTPELFRLPTDYQFEPSARPSFSNYLPNNSFFDSKSAFYNDLFLTTPYRPFSQEMNRPGQSEGQQISLSNRTINHDLYTDPSYPFVPDFMLRVPMIEEGISRAFPSSPSESGFMRISSYDQDFRPNMYS